MTLWSVKVTGEEDKMSSLPRVREEESQKTEGNPTLRPVPREPRTENGASASEAPKGPDKAFGLALKRWRSQRHMSQNDLAMAANVSSRHISFLETGRARPSRKMVLRLAEVLDIPFRGRNTLLESAGHKPAFHETELDDPNLSAVSETLDFILAGHDPYPAIVLDNMWNVIRANRSGKRLLAFLMDGKLDRKHGSSNVIDWLVEEGGLRDHLENWSEIGIELVRRIHRKAEADGSDKRLNLMLGKLMQALEASDLPARKTSGQEAELFMPLNIRKGGLVLNLFSTVTKIGDPRDITLQELSIETLCPADPETQFILKALNDPR